MVIREFNGAKDPAYTPYTAENTSCAWNVAVINGLSNSSIPATLRQPVNEKGIRVNKKPILSIYVP